MYQQLGLNGSSPVTMFVKLINSSEEASQQVELNCNFLASNDLITTKIYHDSNDLKKLTPFLNVLT